MVFTIDKKLLLNLSLAFILMTVVGTVSHEFGHYIAAKIMGFDARINYMKTFLTTEQIFTRDQAMWFYLGGPLQTMLTGTIGFLALCVWGRNTMRPGFGKWCLIFLSLFWLRQSTNFILEIADYLLSGKLSYRADEIKLSRLLGWPDLLIMTVTGIIGLLVLTIVIFKFIPKLLRLTFMLSGLIGGIAGYFLWLVYFGKFIMP